MLRFDAGTPDRVEGDLPEAAQFEAIASLLWRAAYVEHSTGNFDPVTDWLPSEILDGNSNLGFFDEDRRGY
jgi:hypothetical protein